MYIISIIGSVAFALCGIPAAWEAYKNKTCQYSWWFIGLWLTGEVFTGIYVLYLGEWILLFNYGFNLCALLILIRYNRVPR